MFPPSEEAVFAIMGTEVKVMRIIEKFNREIDNREVFLGATGEVMDAELSKHGDIMLFLRFQEHNYAFPWNAWFSVSEIRLASLKPTKAEKRREQVAVKHIITESEEREEIRRIEVGEQTGSAHLAAIMNESVGRVDKNTLKNIAGGRVQHGPIAVNNKKELTEALDILFARRAVAVL